MSNTPASFSQFGQALAFAERAMTATLRRHLAERDTQPETWYALQLIATRGPGVDRGVLSEVLQGSPTMSAESTRRLLDGLAADGLVCGEERLELTPEGAALHRSLRDYVAGPRDRLLGEFPVEDVETTIRTLQGLTRRATEELTLDG